MPAAVSGMGEWRSITVEYTLMDGVNDGIERPSNWPTCSTPCAR